ncbi:MAG: hypothetical protein HXY22_01395 [Alphaproteobacteria bacterium]|nr:hypothetical protein [Alphaproteobacteria bacterium]
MSATCDPGDCLRAPYCCRSRIEPKPARTASIDPSREVFETGLPLTPVEARAKRNVIIASILRLLE